MNKKRLCCFCVNDIHLITMLLPYINERINEDTEVVTMFEKNMSTNANKVLESVVGKKSERLINLDWSNKSLNYLNENNIENKLVLIYGSENFLNEANKIMDSKNESCTILNCYEIMQASSKLNEILDKHDKVVNTDGEKFPEEVFIGYTKNNCKEITV